VRCPPTAFPAADSSRTETSARPVWKSSSKQDYTIRRPSKRPHLAERGTKNSAKTSDPNVRVGVICRTSTCPSARLRFSPINGHRQLGAAGTKSASARYSTSNMHRQDRTRHRRPPRIRFF
jgi:hypothetical protein